MQRQQVKAQHAIIPGHRGHFSLYSDGRRATTRLHHIPKSLPRRGDSGVNAGGFALGCVHTPEGAHGSAWQPVVRTLPPRHPKGLQLHLLHSAYRFCL